jgi:RNA polymerase sigma factor (sigma-70 family)
MSPPPIVRRPPDACLVLEAGRGDEHAVAALTEYYRPRIEQHARRRMRPGLARIVGPDDIAQESLLAACTSMRAAGVHTVRDFERYVFAIAERRLRSAGRRRDVGCFEGGELPEREDPVCDPSRHIETREERRGFRRALAQLRDDHHWVLVLRDYLETPWETAALALDRSSTHAAQCLYDRARAALGRSIR